MTTNTKKTTTTQAPVNKKAELAKYKPLLTEGKTAGGALIPLHLWDDVLVLKKGKQKPLGKAPIDNDWTRKPYDSAKTHQGMPAQ